MALFHGKEGKKFVWLFGSWVGHLVWGRHWFVGVVGRAWLAVQKRYGNWRLFGRFLGRPTNYGARAASEVVENKMFPAGTPRRRSGTWR